MGIGLAAVSLQAATLEASNPDSAPASAQRAALNRYCVACPNEKLKTAGLMLDQMDVEKVAEGAPVWEKVVRKLRTRAMPPAGAPRPDEATYDALATYFETALDRRCSRQSPKPSPRSLPTTPRPGLPTADTIYSHRRKVLAW